MKISAILKDADALDRVRFGTRGRLDPKYLRTRSGRSSKMIVYAQKVNGVYAKKMLDRNYGENDQTEYSAVISLQEARRARDTKEKEDTLSVDEMLELFRNVQREYTKGPSATDKKKTMIKAFGEEEVSFEDESRAAKVIGINDRQLASQVEI